MNTEWTNVQTQLIYDDFFDDPVTLKSFGKAFMKHHLKTDDEWVQQIIKHAVYLNDMRWDEIAAGASDRSLVDVWSNESLMMVDWYQLLNAIRLG